METAIALQVIPTLVERLVTHLYELRTAKKHNKQVVEEIGKFTETLNSNLELLRTKLPKSVSTQALESLAQELGNANNFMEECLSQGTFKKFWNAKETRENLESLRKKLASAFQMTFFITSLDVGIDAHKNMTNFQERMLQLFAAHARDSAAEIRELLQPLLSGAGREGKVQTAIACVEEIRVNQETESSETEKFFGDVLAAINQLPNNVQNGSSHSSENFDDEEFYDPITQELMCDPVKGSDGFTYDRWMILDNEICRSPMTQEPLSIVCDDVNVRRRLFQKFQNHGLEKKFSEKREEYRQQTLELARNGHDAEALERLENVLTWAKGDSECQEFRLAIRDRLHGSASNSNQALSQAGARHSRMSSEPDQTSTMQGPTVNSLTGLGRDLKNLSRPQGRVQTVPGLGSELSLPDGGIPPQAGVKPPSAESGPAELPKPTPPKGPLKPGQVPRGAPAFECFKAGLSHLEQNQLRDAMACFNESSLALAKDQSLILDVKTKAKICAQYKIAVLLLQEIARLQRVEGQGAVAAKEEMARLSRHLSTLPLQPKHRISCIQTAIKRNMDVQNYVFSKKMLDLLISKAPPNYQQELKALAENAVKGGLTDKTIDGEEDASQFCAATLGRLSAIGHDMCDTCSARFSALTSPRCILCGMGTVVRSDAATRPSSSPFA